MSVGYGRKPEYPEETHVDTERTCKLHRPHLTVCGGIVILKQERAFRNSLDHRIV
uniref:Uncharacterized protein n=1 Tax=Anguilla anguilla TaxID=7936 RepID=A0A0E9X3Q1_ANGAN